MSQNQSWAVSTKTKFILVVIGACLLVIALALFKTFIVYKPTSQNTQLNQISPAPTLTALNPDLPRQIIFVKNKHITLINLSNPSSEKILYTATTGDVLYNIKFSPDRQKLLFIHYNGVNNNLMCIHKPCSAELRLLDLTTQKLQTLFISSDYPSDTPISYAWQNNAKILFADSKQLWQESIDTQKPLPLANVPASEFNRAIQFQTAASYVFISSRNQIIKFPIDDTSAKEVLIAGGSSKTDSIGGDFSVSPDGNAIIFTKQHAMVYNPDSKTTAILGDYPCSGYQVGDFSPDSKYFIIYSGCGDSGQAQIFSSSGNLITTLPNLSLTEFLNLQSKSNLTGANVAFNPSSDKIFILTYNTIYSQNGVMQTMYAVSSDLNTRAFESHKIPGSNTPSNTNNTNSDFTNRIIWFSN